MRGLESSELVWSEFEHARGPYLVYVIVWHLASPVLDRGYDGTRAAGG